MASLTNSPFGVNLPILFLSDESMLEVVIEENVKFVTTSAGDPAKYIHILKDAGIKVFHAVPSLAGALKAINAGVDGLVVEGTEGGGFKNPEEVGLYVLLQSIRKHSDIPMVAAGGIVDGIGMAAAFAAGAEGIQMGTRFVSSKESPVHQNYKQAILDSDEQGTYILNKKSKPCVRAIKTDFTHGIYEKGEMDMSAMFGIKKLYFEGDMNAAPALAGQSMGLIDEIKGVEEIINETSKYLSQEYYAQFASKLGIVTPDEKDKRLVDDLLTILAGETADFTNFFSKITNDEKPFKFMMKTAYLRWEKKWQNRVKNIPDAKPTMRQANPVIIPRNHIVEKAIQSALSGDFEPFYSLNEALQKPYDYKGQCNFLNAPKEDEKVTATFCGT